MSASARISLPLCLVIWLGLAGCGLDQVRRAQPVPEETRASLGTVAVVPARYSPEVGLDVFAEGRLWGAIKGTGAGTVALPTLVVMGGVLPGSLAQAGIVAAAGAVAGCVVGTWKAVPQEEANRLHLDAEEILGDAQISERIAERVYRLAGAPRTGHAARYLPEAGPLLASATGDSRSLAEQGVDSVLEVSVREFGLSPIGWLADPVKAPLRLYLKVEGRLYRVVNGEVLYERTLRVSTHGALLLDQWRAGSVALVQEKLAPIEADVAERFAEDVFWVYVQPSQRETGSP